MNRSSWRRQPELGNRKLCLTRTAPVVRAWIFMLDPTPSRSLRPRSLPSRKVSEGTRTPDRLDHNQELYQLSYAHQGLAILGHGEEPPLARDALELRACRGRRTRSPSRRRGRLTVLETSTSPGAGAARPRARRCAPPRRRRRRRSPRTRRCAARRARRCRGRRASSRITSAQRIARAGPSKVARKPSPTVLISRPRKRSSARRTVASWRGEQVAPAPVAQLRRARRSSRRCR